MDSNLLRHSLWLSPEDDSLRSLACQTLTDCPQAEA